MKKPMGPPLPFARHSALRTPNSALGWAGFYNLRASQEVCPKTPKEPP